MTDKLNIAVNYNTEKNGIELTFDKRPSKEILAELKDHGFRWHGVKKIWYAKVTDERKVFTDRLLSKTANISLEEEKRDLSVKRSTKTETKQETKVETNARPNTVAEFYDEVDHNRMIYDSAKDKSLFSLRAGYFKNENVYYHQYGFRGDDTQHVFVELANAQKTGKTCTRYSLSVSYGADITMDELLHHNHIDTVDKLYQAIQEKNPQIMKYVSVSEAKGIDIFSPFVEVKPLKEIPEKWTKKNFTQALLSGQIYKGEVDYRYTDDYAYDAATDFRKGSEVFLPAFMLDVVEGWSSTYYVRGAAPKEGERKTSIHFSEHSNSSKTLYFDLDSNIEKSVAYKEMEQLGKERSNLSMKNSVIHPNLNEIDSNKLYTIKLLDMNQNTELYETKEEPIQGCILKERLSDEYSFIAENLVSFKEMEIVPDRFYRVEPYSYAEWLPGEERLFGIESEIMASGKSVLALTAEGKDLGKIYEDYNAGLEYKDVKENIKDFQSGYKKSLFGPTFSLRRNGREDIGMKEFQEALESYLHNRNCVYIHSNHFYEDKSIMDIAKNGLKLLNGVFEFDKTQKNDIPADLRMTEFLQYAQNLYIDHFSFDDEQLFGMFQQICAAYTDKLNREHFVEHSKEKEDASAIYSRPAVSVPDVNVVMQAFDQVMDTLIRNEIYTVNLARLEVEYSRTKEPATRNINDWIQLAEQKKDSQSVCQNKDNIIAFPQR